MITFNYENDFLLEDESIYQDWISRIIQSENKSEGEINYIFCDDEYLININNEYLNHDTYTDIISFDYSVGDLIQGDIFISTERVAENAIEYNVPFENEIKRVLSHGILHYCGYKDKTDNEALVMRQKEDEKIALFHVEQQ
ncbi:rRNA maturation RNase YbeY [uncultured Flavobacterium sp.]|uniref:rRNA maturation RNase YbeY n=1 Tax=uncultured Flavobacterium sp. TaxID=165435 RepID=UPI0030EDF9BC|tara:strand:+ start:511 stop:933 length:423 start_codon:yes stop_codon:yes gene_type:complete